MFDHRAFLKTLTEKPGVYQMLSAEGTVIYVGKARNLKKRVGSYFRGHANDAKTRALVGQIVDIQIIATASENEALLLECNLIKQHKPRYNILLRDGKGYPYLHMTAHDFPNVTIHRGSRKVKGELFGPYPNGTAAWQTLKMLQKTFKIRQCNDAYFSNRSRPCLQYQIKRCSAPCVKYIEKDAYQEVMNQIQQVLTGKSQGLLDELIQKMELAATEQDYETAATLRDQISSLRKVQESQAVSQGDRDADVIVLVQQDKTHCVYVASIRHGLLLGGKAHFLVAPMGEKASDILSSFIAQYYLNQQHGLSIPHALYCETTLSDQRWLLAALKEKSGYVVAFEQPQRGEKMKLMQLAQENAKLALIQKTEAQTSHAKGLNSLRESLSYPDPLTRLECFDISHTQGEATVGACVVMHETGFHKSDYRRFNIKHVTAGDDGAAMRQSLMRRFQAQNREGKRPQILLIDGGKIQLTQARECLQSLEIDDVVLLGIKKGEGRKASLDTVLLQVGDHAETLVVEAAAKQILQQLRDEAHRFAITGHRGQRAKARKHSTLETISGIGMKRRKALIQRFGGLQEIKGASVDELAKVPGISQTLAAEIYHNFH
ncbi:MAG: UvrABC system protein C [marine bacterium B5-7]|nr:MAG: UvrABC system protein C [marine bacterium B5-7]